jgi:hypothetical protein
LPYNIPVAHQAWNGKNYSDKLNRVGLVTLGLLLEFAIVAMIIHRRSHYPAAAKIVLPAVAILASVTVIGIAGQFRWPKYKIPFVVFQFGSYFAYLGYCYQLPFNSTPGQLMLTVIGFSIINTALTRPKPAYEEW